VSTITSQETALSNLQLQVGSGPVDSRIANAAAAVWSKAGNSASASDFIGTTNNADLVTKTNNTERMRVTSGGVTKIAGPVEINSTSGGLLMSRLTTAQRDAMSATPGTTIYNTSTNKFQGYALVTGSETLDQSQTSFNGTNTSINVSSQSFTAGVTGVLSRITIRTLPYGSSNHTLTVYSGNGTGGTVLSSQTINIASFYGEQTFTLSTPVNVVSGNIYTFGFSGGSYTALEIINTNPYSSGSWLNQASWDIYFKTFIIPVSGTWVDLH